MKKTPRDLLLSQHAAATPQLAQLRHKTLDDATPIPARQLLHALFFPQRRLWFGLAAAWVVILALHLTQPAPPRPDAKTIEYAAKFSAANQARLYAVLTETSSYR